MDSWGMCVYINEQTINIGPFASFLSIQYPRDELRAHRNPPPAHTRCTIGDKPNSNSTGPPSLRRPVGRQEGDAK